MGYYSVSPDRILFAVGTASLLWCLLFVEDVRAQMVPGVPRAVLRGTLDRRQVDALKSLPALYRAGKWAALQRRVGEAVGQLKLSEPGGTAPSHELVPKKHYYSVILVSSDIRGKPELMRFIWHDPPLNEYVGTVPGLKPGGDAKLYELFLGEGIIECRSRYSSKEEPDPFLERLPAFINKIDPTKMGFKTAPAESTHGTAYLFEVPVRSERVTIEIENAVSVPFDARMARDSLVKALERIEAWEARVSSCAVTHVKETKLLISSLSLPDLVPPSTYFAMLTEVRARARSQRQDCARNWESVLAVDKGIDEIVARSLVPWIESKYRLVNRPHTQVSFGIISGFTVGNSGDEPAKLEGEKLTQNTDTRVVPMFALNLHPIGYDPESLHMETGERWRLFLGGIVVPDPGVAVGGGAAIVRGLTLNAGIGWLVVDRLNEGDHYGSAPSDPDEPFQTGIRNIFFLGFGYNWKD